MAGHCTLCLSRLALICSNAWLQGVERTEVGGGGASGGSEGGAFGGEVGGDGGDGGGDGGDGGGDGGDGGARGGSGRLGGAGGCGKGPRDITEATCPEPKSTAGKASPISAGRSPTTYPSGYMLLGYPSSKLLFEPKHLRSPLSRMTHVCLYQAATCVADRPAPRLTAGKPSPISDSSSPNPSCVWPNPSWPSEFKPKHLRSPLSRMTHVRLYPAATCVADRPLPRSTAGNRFPIS